MNRAARTPEELETLLEDAFVVREQAALAGLFEAEALLAVAGRSEARGDEVAIVLAGLWGRDSGYLAAPQRVLQLRDTALIVSGQAISVARRGPDRDWRYAIALLSPETQLKGRHP